MAAKFKVGQEVKRADGGKNSRHYRVASILTKQTGTKTFVKYELNPIKENKIVAEEKVLVAV